MNTDELDKRASDTLETMAANGAISRETVNQVWDKYKALTGLGVSCSAAFTDAMGIVLGQIR